MKSFALGLLRLYKRWISPAFPPSCRYVPTCSEYAMEAVERYGVVRGGAMAAWRLLRCHPLAKGGLDAVVKDAPKLATEETPVKSTWAGLDAIERRPSAAKAACVAGSNGMAEAMPLQSHPGTDLVRVP